MKPRFSPTAQQWRWAALLLSILMLLSMAVPGSLAVGDHYDADGSGFKWKYGSYFKPVSWSYFFSCNCVLLGAIALGCCLWSVIRKTSVFFSLLVVTILNLCLFAWVHYMDNIHYLMQIGINVSFVFVPPLLAALTPVAAFLARRAEKKE